MAPTPSQGLRLVVGPIPHFLHDRPHTSLKLGVNCGNIINHSRHGRMGNTCTTSDLSYVQVSSSPEPPDSETAPPFRIIRDSSVFQSLRTGPLKAKEPLTTVTADHYFTKCCLKPNQPSNSSL